MSDFQEITEFSIWSYIDQLGGSATVKGQELKPGLYDINWPDGSTSQGVRINVNSFNDTANNMGQPVQIPVRRALVQVTVNGFTAYVRAVGLCVKATEAAAETAPEADPATEKPKFIRP